METALFLFSQKGYEGTGIQEIVDRAGVGKPTMYYYFGNKEGVLNAILESNFYGFIEKLRNAARYDRNITLSITSTVKTFFEIASRNQHFYRMFLSMSSEAPNTPSYRCIDPYRVQICHIIETLFLKAEEDHGNMKGRQKEYSLSFLGMVNTYALLIINNEAEVTENLVYRVVHQFMHGIFS